MTEPSTDPAEAPTDVVRVAHRWRRTLVVVLAILSCISILASTVGVWAHRTLLNTDSWVNAVAPLASNPEVTTALSKQVTASLLEVINADEVAQNALPDQAKFLAAPLTEAVGQFVQRSVDQLLKTEQFQQFWVDANRKVHPIVVKVLRGETKGVTAANNQVQLNLLPLIADALRFVQSKAAGLLGSATTIPKITFDMSADEARSKLSSALGRSLPENFGVVTVFQSDKLKAVQDGVALFDNLITALLILTVLMVVATVGLALDRRRIIIGLSLGMVFTLALASTIIAAIKSQALDLITDPTSRVAAGDTVTTLVSRLHLITNGLIAVGLAVALIAFLTGGSRLAVGIRSGASRLVRALGSKVDSEGAPAALVWVQQHSTELRWGGLVVGFGLLVFAVNGWVGLFVTLLVVGLFEAAIAYAAARQHDESVPVS